MSECRNCRMGTSARSSSQRRARVPVLRPSFRDQSLRRAAETDLPVGRIANPSAAADGQISDPSYGKFSSAARLSRADVVVPLLLTVLLTVSSTANAQQTAASESNSAITKNSSAERGYRILRTKGFLPPDFDQQVFDELWKIWPEPLIGKARQATVADRRRMAFSRYGLMEVPRADAEESDDRHDTSRLGTALGYVDNGHGGWIMNCLACHAGKVAGRVIPGLPNSHFALQTLTEDVRLTKLRLLKRFSHLDLASLKLPLGSTHGTTNSVVFGIVLGALRDHDMKVDRTRPVPKQVHHDMDAPPLWNVRKKSMIYIDGFAPKNNRVLMQFMLLPANDQKTVQSWEADFRNILAWIESLKPPKYPWEIDRALASRGEAIFNKTCSRCHGTYGDDATYPERTIPIGEIKTDPVRLQALTIEHRRWMRDGWLSRYGKDPVVIDPVGYVAPPLDGIWASAPYVHNGSIPTLWHLLHPNQRPIVWKRTEDGYDREKVGLEVTTFNKLPKPVTAAAERRQYFQTQQLGKSAAGHRFPDALTDDEKQAVLEYLKTL